MTAHVDDQVYVALIGDIRGSRTVENRNEVQTAFKRLISSLNEQIPTDSIASQFTVTTGDEFQVLLTDAAETTLAELLQANLSGGESPRANG